jgi:hypothetical protein
LKRNGFVCPFPSGAAGRPDSHRRGIRLADTAKAMQEHADFVIDTTEVETYFHSQPNFEGTEDLCKSL